jgi:hypothetical protein
VTVTPTATPLTSAGTAIGNLTAAVAWGFNQGDPAITSSGGSYLADPYVLAYYLQHVAAPSLASLTFNFGTAFPGVDPSQPMTVATFLAGIAPQLPAGTLALSGLGRSQAHAVVSGRYRGGWAT